MGPAHPGSGSALLSIQRPSVWGGPVAPLGPRGEGPSSQKPGGPCHESASGVRGAGREGRSTRGCPSAVAGEAWLWAPWEGPRGQGSRERKVQAAVRSGSWQTRATGPAPCAPGGQSPGLRPRPRWLGRALPRHRPPSSPPLRRPACRRLGCTAAGRFPAMTPLCVCPPTPHGLAPRSPALRPSLPAALATATASAVSTGVQEGRGAAGVERVPALLPSPATPCLWPVGGMPPPPTQRPPEARPHSLPDLQVSSERASVWECALTSQWVPCCAPGVGAPAQGRGRAPVASVFVPFGMGGRRDWGWGVDR